MRSPFEIRQGGRNQTAKAEKVSTVVHDIRCQIRRNYSAEENIRIVLEGLRGRKLLFGSDVTWLHPGLELHKTQLFRLRPRDETLSLGGSILPLLRVVRWTPQVIPVTAAHRLAHLLQTAIPVEPIDYEL
jgi:hypothetical protein